MAKQNKRTGGQSVVSYKGREYTSSDLTDRQNEEISNWEDMHDGSGPPANDTYTRPGGVTSITGSSVGDLEFDREYNLITPAISESSAVESHTGSVSDALSGSDDSAIQDMGSKTGEVAIDSKSVVKGIKNVSKSSSLKSLAKKRYEALDEETYKSPGYSAYAISEKTKGTMDTSKPLSRKEYEMKHKPKSKFEYKKYVDTFNSSFDRKGSHEKEVTSWNQHYVSWAKGAGVRDYKNDVKAISKWNSGAGSKFGPAQSVVKSKVPSRF